MSGITEGLSAHGREAGWAGTFTCCGPCGRKRLVAAEFSKAQITKKQKDEAAEIKCKQCVEAAQQAERDAAKKKAEAAAPKDCGPVDAATAANKSEAVIDVTDAAPTVPELHECASCKKSLAADKFNRTQLVQKGPGKQRCRECVEKAEASTAGAAKEKQDAGIEEARKALKQAEIGGNAAATLVAASKLAALEGEKVTGLKPVVLGKGRGRGRGGGGSWRGRSGGK